MSEITIYAMTLWLSGFCGGFSISCVLAIFAIKHGWVRITRRDGEEQL